MSSTSSDESYVPPQKSRLKRYSKVKSAKHPLKIDHNKSCTSKSIVDASFPSCSGYRARSSSKPASNTSSSSEYDTEIPLLGLVPSVSDNCLNNNVTICYPTSLGIKAKVVIPSERQKRWQRVAEENKELLSKVNFSQFNSLRDSPLLNNFRKRKSDPEFRRSLNRPSKAIKIFSDEEEDKKPSASTGFPFNKEYDDHFRNLKFYESDEELSKYLKAKKTKGKIRSSYKGGPLADECLLPIDYKKIFESDSEHPSQPDTDVKKKAKQKSPVRTKTLEKKSKSSVNKKSCPKITSKKQLTKKPKSEKRNLPLPSSKPVDDDLFEFQDNSSVAEHIASAEDRFDKSVQFLNEYLARTKYKLFDSDSEHPSQSDTSVKKEEKAESPVKSKSSLNKKSVKEQSTKKPNSEKKNLPLPSYEPVDGNFTEYLDNSFLEADSEDDELTPCNSVSADHALALQIAYFDKEFGNAWNFNTPKLSPNESLSPVAEFSDSQHASQSHIWLKDERSEKKRASTKESKPCAKAPRLTIKQRSTAKKQSSAKKYKSRGNKSTYECQKAESLSSQVVSLLPIDDKVRKSKKFSETSSIKDIIQDNVAVSSKHTVLVPVNESKMVGIDHSKKSTKNQNDTSSSKESDFFTYEREKPDVHAKKIKITLLSHECIINDKIPRVSLMKIPFKLPYVNLLSR